MFQTGDYIVYGSNGVCEIAEIGTPDIPGMSKERLYYTLRPLYEKKSTIFTPVDNKKVVMRAVLTKDEALDLIDEMSDIGFLIITDEKQREAQYRECFLKCDCRELVKMIHTIDQRRTERLAQGKKVTAKDEKYFHMAEDNLYGELAVSLGIGKDEVGEFIESRAV